MAILQTPLLLAQHICKNVREMQVSQFFKMMHLLINQMPTHVVQLRSRTVRLGLLKEIQHLLRECTLPSLNVLTLFLLIVTFIPLFALPSHASPDNRTERKVLIVYYSWGGNTRQVVNQIQKTIQADVFELKTVDPYPKEYRPTTVQAKKELESGYRPPLSSKIENIDQYDTIIIGSPNWWGSLASPVFTFLESYDLSGKTVALYITHEGSRLGRAMDDLKNLCPKSTILEGLAIRGGSVGSSQKDVESWLHAIGLAQ